MSVFEQTERHRGRTERRRVEVYAPAAWRGDWPALGSLVRVVRSGERQGRPYEKTGLYLTSRTDEASGLAEAIRGHWGVENRVHWCKDAQFGEDRGRMRSAAGASVLSLLRGAALSSLRHGGAWSVVEARSRLANRVPALLAYLRT